MKYKVGDRVKIRADLAPYEVMYGADFVVKDMLPFLGCTATLTACVPEYEGQLFFLDVDTGEWCWTPEMFEGLAE